MLVSSILFYVAAFLYAINAVIQGATNNWMAMSLFIGGTILNIITATLNLLIYLEGGKCETISTR